MNNDYKEINDMMKTAREMIKSNRDITNFVIETQYGFDLSFKERFNGIMSREISEMTDEELEKKFHLSEYEKEINSNFRPEDGKTLEEYKREIVLDIARTIESEIKAEHDYIKLKKEQDKITKEYLDYLKSKEYREKYKERIMSLENEAKTTTDSKRKQELYYMIDRINSMTSLSFLFSRMNSVENEKDAVIETLFSPKRSSYLMQKFKKQLETLKVAPYVYRYYTNLEERYLGEEYHDFNNLFLFYVIRFIAYSDMNNPTARSFSTALILRLHNLVFNEISDDDKFILFNTIEKLDEYFFDKRDIFIEKNTTRPNHPYRLNREKEFKENEIKSLHGRMWAKYSGKKQEEWRSKVVEELERVEKEEQEKLATEETNEMEQPTEQPNSEDFDPYI